MSTGTFWKNYTLHWLQHECVSGHIKGFSGMTIHVYMNFWDDHTCMRACECVVYNQSVPRARILANQSDLALFILLRCA